LENPNADIYRSHRLNIWEAIEIGPFIPSIIVGNATIEKPREQWDEYERRRVHYNLKFKNIITSALGMDKYFRVSNCKNAKKDMGYTTSNP